MTGGSSWLRCRCLCRRFGRGGGARHLGGWGGGQGGGWGGPQEGVERGAFWIVCFSQCFGPRNGATASCTVRNNSE